MSDNSGKYVPPHLRNQGGNDQNAQQNQPQVQRGPRFESSQVSQPYRPHNSPMPRSHSMPTGFRTVSDQEVEEAFSMNEESGDMSVYEGANVTVTANAELEPVAHFPGCGICNEILLPVAQMGFKSPTAVQKYAIPYVLHGDDVIVTAQTGSGKTAAFMLPVISQIMRIQQSRGPVVVALVPTRELALQIQKETRKFSQGTGLKIVCVFGGAPINDQLKQLRYQCDILIATPGRLIDIMERGQLTLQYTRYLILDEADRMLDMGFEPQINTVIHEFDMPSAEFRQTLFFSATFPTEVQNLAYSFMRPDVTRISVGIQDAPSLIEQRFIYVNDNSKLSALLDAINQVEGQTLVFAERKVSVDRIEEFLYDEGCAVVAIHGDREMSDRLAALRGFTGGRASIMVATDVAARGIDIPNVTHVINLDLPTDVDSYIHRIGRTGRAGRHGIATSFWNESNTPFLSSLVSHLNQNRHPIPEGLEEFERSNHGYGGRGRQGHSTRGGQRGRGGGHFPRDRSYNNMQYKY